MHASRECRIEHRKAPLDRSRQRQRVRTGLLLHGQDHGRLTVDTGLAAFEAHAGSDLGNLMQAQAGAVAITHRDLTQILRAERSAECTDGVLASAGVGKAATEVAAEAAHRLHQVRQRHTQHLHAREIWLHFVLTHFAADRNHLRDAGHAQQCGPQCPVRQIAQLHRRGAARVGTQRQQQDLAHQRGWRTDSRLCAVRQLPAQGFQPFGDELAIAIDIARPVELGVHHAQPDRRH